MLAKLIKPKKKKLQLGKKDELHVPKTLGVLNIDVIQESLQQNQVNRKIVIKQINFLNRVQKPWRYNWKRYSKWVKNHQKPLRDYTLHFCKDQPRKTHFLMEIMKVRLFVTQRSNKFLIILFNLRMKKRIKQTQTQHHKRFLMGFSTCWSRLWILSCSWGWTV